jgi:site-specific recombinase XerD
MVRSRYPYLLQQRRRWFVRMVVPADVRDIIGQSIFKVPTGHTDEHRASAVAAPIIAVLQDRIRTAREAGRRLEQVTAEQLAERYRAERTADSDLAEATKIADIITYALETNGLRWVDHARQVRAADYDAHAAMRLLPGGDAAAGAADVLTGHATPFLSYLERWKPHAGLKPRPLDQATSSLKQFDKAVKKPIERIEDNDVQQWIDDLINPEGDSGLNSKTVNRKLGEIRNYWMWLQSHKIVPKTRNPFAGHRVRDPASRRKGKDEQRQRFRPEDIIRCWTAAEQQGDSHLAAAIRIAAYSGARIEGVSQLRTADIRVDPDTKIRFMRMDDKTAAGDRFVPVHPKISPLIDRLIKGAGEDGYLIYSAAKNKYGERSQPIGKRFGRLKTDLGFDHRYVFHSLRKTVTHLLESAECPPGVAKDIIGHAKTDMTFGIYSGETRMDHRARWLAKAIRYPVVKDVRHPVPPDQTETHPRPSGRSGRRSSTSGRAPRGTER